LAIGPIRRAAHHRAVRTITTLLLAALLSGCAATSAGTQPAASVQQSVQPTARDLPTAVPGKARLEPASGTYFGMNLDWANDSIAKVSERLGKTPAVWVQFVPFPLDAAARQNLDDFVHQVAQANAMALITLEPNDGLAAVTDAAIAGFASLLKSYADRGVPSFVRFAHEMNGSWYAWGEQPAAYVDAFRRLAAAVHAATPFAAMLWAPNYGAGYPFSGGRYEARPDTPEFTALDTDADGALTERDDPYAPYYPGDDAVDWVGMSLYQWGNAYPWGENELPEADAFVARLTGTYRGANGDESAVPDFYASYVEAHDKPMAITETAILFDPAGPGPAEAELKGAWWRQVFAPAVRERFPRIGMINWFEWRKQEAEVGRVIDWRISADPALARSLLDELPDGWLRFASAR
jgi:hypothetical protein